MIRLTGKQRDFLASYPNEVVVVVSHEDASLGVDEAGAPDEGTIIIDAEGVPEAYESIEVPPGGFIDQPTVTLSDWEEELDTIPELALTADMLQHLRDERIEEMPDEAVTAFFAFKATLDDLNGTIDWDHVLRIVYEGTTP